MNVLSPFAVAVLLPTAVVIVAVAAVLWRERTSSQDARVAIASGIATASCSRRSRTESLNTCHQSAYPIGGVALP
jgi:hypothetical protein